MKDYFQIINEECEKRRKLVFLKEKDIKKFPEVWKFYRKILKYKYHKLSNKRNNLLTNIKNKIYLFLKEVISFNSHLDFILDFQSFLTKCILEDGSFKVIYYKYEHKNNEIIKVISTKEEIESFPVIYYGDDLDNSQDIKLLDIAFKKLIQYEKYRYKKSIIDYNKNFNQKVVYHL